MKITKDAIQTPNGHSNKHIIFCWDLKNVCSGLIDAKNGAEYKNIGTRST
uniref:Uncharacterized protein n=1 Tax=Arundo donax TaxID=35708 RepID=A0A0A9D0L6_ARUDO